MAYNSYREADAQLAYWRLASGVEVDFIVNDMELAIEVKAAEKITSNHLKGLRHLAQDHPRAGRRVVVCREPRARRTDDGIEILPAATFIRHLWRGDLF